MPNRLANMVPSTALWNSPRQALRKRPQAMFAQREAPRKALSDHLDFLKFVSSHPSPP